MVKKIQKSKASSSTGTPLGASVKDSAQQIWQAGLGAFTRAQAEGSKAFESLVKEGVSMQRKTQAAAEGKINEATAKMSTMANDITSKASGQWDKLVNIFEERVAKALNKLGVPSAKDMSALVERIEELNKTVQKLSAKAPRPATSTKAPAKKAAPAPVAAAKKVPSKKASAAKPAGKKAPSKKAVASKAPAAPADGT
jgi:poly(hydroxyalkanoate) granule-associated protein